MMRRARIGFFAMSLAACRPEIGDPESLITTTRILAVRSDPAETKPGDAASYSALIASPDGPVTEPALHWAYCKAPKPLTENNAVSTFCLGDAVEPLSAASGPTITTSMPADACSLFGPDTPPGDLRPRDPDVTGGFYQPLRVELGGLIAFGLERVTCNLPNAPIDIAIDLAEHYKSNQNPSLTPLSATSSGGSAVLLDQIPRGARVHLEAGWAPDDAEMYPAFDPAAQTIVERREALRVSWFVTGGALDSDVTGRSGDDYSITSANDWVAPDAPGEVYLWIVLRDERGGVDFDEYDLLVAP